MVLLEQRERQSPGMSGGVFRTDALEDVLVFFAVKAAQRIGAQDIYIVCFGQIVSELFESNGRIRPAFRLQESHGFTEHDHLRPRWIRCFCSCFNQAANAPEKSDRIRHVIVHDCRERVGSIQ